MFMINKGNIKILLIIIILLVLFVCILTFLLMNQVKRKDEIRKEHESYILTLDTSYKVLENKSIAYTLKRNINSYLKYITDKNSDKLYSILSEKYVKENNITTQDVLSKVKKHGDFKEFWIKKVYYKEIEANKQNEYHIKGEILTKNYKTKEEIYLVVNIDFQNSTYSITPYDNINLQERTYEEIIQELIEKENKGMVPVSETYGKGTEIKENSYNKLEILNNITDEVFIKDYIEMYIININYYPQDAYNMLEDNYKQKFKNEDEYTDYIREKVKEKIIVSKYKIDKYENYKKYTIVTQDNQEIILKETSPMQYKIVSD